LTAQRERLPVGSVHFERTQDPEVEHSLFVASSPRDYEDPPRVMSGR
jgi:hypothetical protein